MIKENKYMAESWPGITQSNLPAVVKKDSLITIFVDYLNKLFMRNTKEKYKAEVYKVINLNIKNN